MRAGELKYRLTILKPVKSQNGYGEEETTYKETVTIHAGRVKMSGHRSEEVGEHFPDYSAEFQIRDAHEVEENWRVKQLGGYLYTVVNIIPNIDRGMNTLICERVNE